MDFAVPLVCKGPYRYLHVCACVCVASICVRQVERWKTCALMTAILYLRYTRYITVNLYTCIVTVTYIFTVVWLAIVY